MSELVPLCQIRDGQIVLIAQIAGGHGIVQRLRVLGLRPGVRLTVVSGMFAGGPIVLQIGRTQTALGRGICRNILVEPNA